MRTHITSSVCGFEEDSGPPVLSLESCFQPSINEVSSSQVCDVGSIEEDSGPQSCLLESCFRRSVMWVLIEEDSGPQSCLLESCFRRFGTSLNFISSYLVVEHLQSLQSMRYLHHK
ncbi:unnamed protein product [Lepeophtheirus salmonis]|uniref:(salmon louse) hypothetical protein n=1 Tax=Lepeophtheirus salmonis TaxID=72036 RepID=A0A7R8CX13_LEPSM|nr:unnamed protein product [Lepeophtheirus salmonis]CAF2910727.1 unnamed protein product [Lepeophtheirus salmonis]